MKILPKSKTHKWAIAIFLVATAMVFFDKLGGVAWAGLMFSDFLALIGRDNAKDDDGAIKEYIRGKHEKIKNYSDSDLASAIDKRLDARK